MTAQIFPFQKPEPRPIPLMDSLVCWMLLPLYLAFVLFSPKEADDE